MLNGWGSFVQQHAVLAAFPSSANIITIKGVLWQAPFALHPAAGKAQEGRPWRAPVEVGENRGPQWRAEVEAARQQVLAELARVPSEQFFDAQESAQVADETASAAGDIATQEPTFYDAGVPSSPCHVSSVLQDSIMCMYLTNCAVVPSSAPCHVSSLLQDSIICMYLTEWTLAV